MAGREKGISKRADGRYVKTVMVEDADGKRHRKYVYGRTQKEVQKKVADLRAEIARGIAQSGANEPLQSYLEFWLEQVRRPHLRPNSYISYRTALDLHIGPALGHIPLQKLTPQHIEAFYGQMIRDEYAPASVAIIHSMLHGALKRAVRREILTRNVIDLVDRPRILARNMHPLTLEQGQHLLDTARGHRLEYFLTVALATGMRKGELRALRWNDVDMTRGRLHVKRTVSQRGKKYGGYIETEPKTAASKRVVVLTDFAKDALVRQKELQEREHAEAGAKWEERDLVFTNTIGGYIEDRSLSREFRALLTKAGLPRIRFHDVRHTTATNLLKLGVHPKVVQELLGHSSIRITLDLYSHVLPSIQEEAMAVYNDAWKRRT